MGKGGLNFAARSIVSPDPNISVNEVGVPLFLARTLTLSEGVAPFNIKR